MRRAVLALGFGSSAEAAATLAIGGLLQPFDNLLQRHIALWQEWQAERSERYAVPLYVPPALADEFLVSTIVLRSHLDKTFPGAMVASLSIPWGDSGNERGGYHLVWPRDLVETAGALLALGAEQEARDTLRYLMATQLGDGRWHPNQWLGGTPYWQGIQLDETAFPDCSHPLSMRARRSPRSHWGHDGWQHAADVSTSDSGLGFHVAVLEVAQLMAGTWIDFTWQSQQTHKWHGRDYSVTVEAAEPS